MNTIQKLLIPATLLVVGLLTAQIIYSCQLVTDGKQIKEIDKQIENLEQQVSLNEEQVASASSLLAIRDRSIALGFVETPKILTISQDSQVVALGQSR